MATTWSEILDRNVWLARGLNVAEAEHWKDCVRIFVAEKNWEGCDGLKLDDEIRVTIAGHACLLLVGVDQFYFDNVQTLLVYPDSFQRKFNDGLVANRSQYRSGEAWQGGPVVLSWGNVLHAGHHHQAGQNVVIHEFAHVLDGLDGEMGGNPIFETAELSEEWHEVVTREYDALRRSVEQGHPTLLDPYGATNPAEFFAVSTETFYGEPLELQHAHPDLFRLLRHYYHVDPIKWHVQIDNDCA